MITIRDWLVMGRALEYFLIGNLNMAYKDPEINRIKNNERKLKNYYKYLEENRAKSRDRKRNKRAAERDAVNQKQRDNYHAKRAENARKQNQRRIRREPHRGLEIAIRDCDWTPQGINQLVGLMRERLTSSNGINDSGKD